MQRNEPLDDVSVGDTINFWIHASDENYTGTVQEILTINGTVNMLILCENDYKLISVQNMYGITLVQPNTVEVEVDDPPMEEEMEEEMGPGQNDEDQSSPLLRRAISIIKTLLPPHPEPIIIYNTDEEDEHEKDEDISVTCPICLDFIDVNQNAASTNCGHKFHFSCILKNMASNTSMHNACPLCRTPVMEGITVCDDEDSMHQMYLKLADHNQRLTEQLQQRQFIQHALMHQITIIERLQSRILDAQRLIDQTAVQIINQYAIETRLDETISGLVASAANNNIRENYDELYEFYHDEIRNICFNLGMRILCGPRDEHVQGSPVQPQHPIIID
jgi:hypothetical protein